MKRARIHTLLLLMGGFIAHKLSILLAWNGDALAELPWGALQPDCFVALFCTWGVVTGVVLLGALALFARRGLGWPSASRLLAPAFALALGGALAFLSLVFSGSSMLLVMLAAGIMSVGYALLHFVWAVLALRSSLLTVLVALTVGQLVTSLSFLALKQAGTEVQASFLIASCAILFVTVHALAAHEDDADDGSPLVTPEKTHPLRDPLVIGIAASALGVGILWGSSPSLRDYTLWVFGAVAVCATFFAVSLARKREANPEALIRLVFAMLGIAILLNAVVPDWHAVFMGAVWVGYSMLSLCVFLLGRNGGGASDRPDGTQLVVALALFDVCIALGLATGRAMSVAAPSIETPTTVAVALLLAFIFLFGTRTRARANRAETQPADIEDINEVIRAQCRTFGARHDLTEAECDTLFYVVKGLTIKRIAGERFVSLNTIKSQMTSIYRKVGVHSKQDLLAMLEREHPRADA